MSYPNQPTNPFEFNPAGGYNDPGNQYEAPRVLTPGEILFSFEGRIRRGTWWLYGIGVNFVLIMIMLVIQFICLSAFDGDQDKAAPILMLLLLPLQIVGAWISLALNAKRWHDVGKSGWWTLINAVCIVGPIYAFVMNGFVQGEPRRNMYGLPQA